MKNGNVGEFFCMTMFVGLVFVAAMLVDPEKITFSLHLAAEALHLTIVDNSSFLILILKVKSA